MVVVVAVLVDMGCGVWYGGCLVRDDVIKVVNGVRRGCLSSSHPDIPLDLESFDCAVPPRVMYWESMSLSLSLSFSLTHLYILKALP